jgi:NAD(P)-dependent dehydrogenase (short-subunit alcohol dehydrogenase family)
MQSLTDKTVIVTGASRGIGRSTAKVLAREGMVVAAVARSAGDLDTLTAEVEASGGRIITRVADMADLESLPGLIKALHAELGTIDVLVNNAGTFAESAISDMSVEDWEYVQRVNVTAPFVLCREVLPIMAKAGSGRIVNIGSTSGVQGYLKQGAYCASKHAMLGMSRVLVMEAKPLGIHVNTLCPGGVRTNLLDGTYLAERMEGQPMIEPDDIGEQVAFIVAQPDNLDIPEMIVRRFVK